MCMLHALCVVAGVAVRLCGQQALQRLGRYLGPASRLRMKVVSCASALKESRRLLGNEFRYNVRATFLGVSEGGELVHDDPDKALRA